MVITSGNKVKAPSRLRNAQIRYALVYVILTFIALLFLNIYCAKSSHKLFFNSKKKAMMDRCEIISTEISKLNVLNETTISNAIADISQSSTVQTFVTDPRGDVIYDSKESAAGSAYGSVMQIKTALQGKDVFTWDYHDGVMKSQAAVPIYSYGTLVGCVYLTESDKGQGSLISALQISIFTITLILEVTVIIFSLRFSTAYSKRAKKLLSSIHTVQSGDYSHKVDIGGHDELTSLADAFNDMTSRLENSESRRRQFVSDASHELKTPLASIKLLSDSIMQNEMPLETTKEFVNDIGEEADRLNRMSQKLLTLARTENDDSQDYEITKIAPTVERVVRMLSAIAKSNDVTIETSLSDDVPILILEDDLYQIIFNLAENGIKYNRPGGKLTISLKSDDDLAIINVQDTGSGIPEDSIDHIFERFYRVDKARSRSTGGSGLGLSIVRSIVTRNHGSIDVDSVVGHGTTFTVKFPVFNTDKDL